MFRSAVERAGLRVRGRLPPLPEPVLRRPGMWEKVVLNLLSNAFKFTFDGEIRVSPALDGEHAVLSPCPTPGSGSPPRAAPAVRAVPPDPGRARALERGQRDRPGAGARARAAARRHRRRREHARRGHDVHRAAPAGHRAPAGRARRAGASAGEAPPRPPSRTCEEALRWLPDAGRAAPTAVRPRPRVPACCRRRQRRHARLPRPPAARATTR